MKLKDAKPGQRIILTLNHSDWHFPSHAIKSHSSIEIVATVIEQNDVSSPYTTLGFRQGERSHNGSRISPNGRESKIDLRVNDVCFVKSETQCQPSYNRRFEGPLC
jgi:hypothetical protein